VTCFEFYHFYLSFFCSYQELNYFQATEITEIERGIGNIEISIGVKKLLGLVEMSLQTDEASRAEKFVTLLEEYCRQW